MNYTYLYHHIVVLDKYTHSNRGQVSLCGHYALHVCACPFISVTVRSDRFFVELIRRHYFSAKLYDGRNIFDTYLSVYRWHRHCRIIKMIRLCNARL